jgi:ABC-2 type transport system ATP-binding protein
MTTSLVTQDSCNTEKLCPVIQVEGLNKRYGKLVAVRGIDFTVHQGEIFGLIGPDGAGKTTTFHILAGVMESSSGKVQILSQPARNARLNIGYLTQQFSLYLDLSIDENLRYSAGLRQIPDNILKMRRDKYLQLMGLERFSNCLAGQLSGGMKQKLALCCALVSQPKILLLDEPTTGVDPVSRREFWDVLAALASEGVTTVVATPYLDEAERCNRIALIYEGQIQQIGTLKQLQDSLGLERLEVYSDKLETLVAAEKILLKAVNENNDCTLAIHPDREYAAIADVQSFGDRLDILVTDAQKGELQVRQLLNQHQILSNIQATDATLENVFVTHVRQHCSEPPFIPLERSHQASFSPSIAIGANNLNKVFGSFQAVRDVNLEIRYGEIYGLLGANGAGKTTTIKILCGLMKPTSGIITLAGQTHNLRNSELRRHIGYMSQKFTLYDNLSIVENLEFYCGVYRVPRHFRRNKIDWVLTTCGLKGRENMLTGQLPGGWKQRVAFGASVMHEPKILFLDEPTSGVDPVARRQFWRLIEDFARSHGTAVLVTTHYLEEAEHCNRIGFMVAGELVNQGSPSQIKAQQPGQLLEVVCDRIQAASDLLKYGTEKEKPLLESWRVAIFGSKLHVVLDDPDTEISKLRSTLEKAQLKIHSLRPIPFSLEDAFIGIVSRSKTY